MTTYGYSGVTWCPTTSQISHFTNQGANLIRLPVGWQYLVGSNVASTSLDQTYLATYDALVQGVLNTGAYAIIDIHNYARWNGGVVGTDVSGQYFANLWSLLAAKYKNNSRVIFGMYCWQRRTSTNCSSHERAPRHLGYTVDQLGGRLPACRERHPCRRRHLTVHCASRKLLDPP